MFERLMLCHYAVADITGANPNVFYELGIRHAMRPRSTVIVLNEGTVLPFDIALVRGIAYKTDAGGEPVEVEATRAAIADQLKSARGLPHDDSPIFQLIEGLPRFEVDHAKTDIFRQAVDYSEKYKERLHAAVREGPEAVETIANEPALANLLEIEGGVVVDLFLSLRDVKAHAAMIDLYERMPRPLQRAKMMREQLAFALNREGRFEEAEKVLKEVIAEFGPSSETNGLLGRVYKDRWDRAKQEGLPEARALLKNRHVSCRLRGGLARCLSRRQRGDPDGDDAEARPAPGRYPTGGTLRLGAKGAGQSRLLGLRYASGAGGARARQ
jgi:hypothetical protein